MEELIDLLNGEITFEEYVFFLSEREVLDNAIKNLSTKTSVFIESLKSLDEAFMVKTVESDQNVWGNINEQKNNWNKKEHWYYYRLPKQAFLKDCNIK